MNKAEVSVHIIQEQEAGGQSWRKELKYFMNKAEGSVHNIYELEAGGQILRKKFIYFMNKRLTVKVGGEKRYVDARVDARA